ncbi:hypothetical protein ACFV0T_15785 [Streptomyces sp. NPDC059582]|uniref:hypothetical protein n=1 Tax=Streptomyces sp. NPDC059582 TaxID=3346875 RepID=UPI0036A14E6D
MADRLGRPRVARRNHSLLLDGGFGGVTVETHTHVFTDAATLPLLVSLADCSSASPTARQPRRPGLRKRRGRPATGRRLARRMPPLSAGQSTSFSLGLFESMKDH